MITPAQRAEIRRLFYGEHWKVGTIAAQLGLHRETVRAAVERETAGVRPSLCRPSIRDPYLPFIRDTLAQYPRLRATRIHEMVRQRGYAGSVFPVRRLVRRLRPESGRAVYRRVVTLVGEQAQVDWGSFGKVHIGQGTRTVSGFVMVLGYSRALWPRCSPSTRRWRASCGGTSTPSRRWEAPPATSCTTTCAAPCSTAAAPPCSFIPACSTSPAITTSHRAPARRAGEMRREKSRGRSNTYGTRSSPRGPSATSTTSTPSSAAGETRSPTAGVTPTSPTAVSPTSGPKRSSACCRYPLIPSRPTWCASSAPARPPMSASTAISTRFPTPTSESRSPW